MVTHGGENGQLVKYGYADEYIFDWTQEDIKAKIKLENGEQGLPTLHEVLSLFKSAPFVFVNVELKGPID